VWKAVVESAIGTSHQHSGLPCQDAGDLKLLFNRSVLIGAVSDGTSSAKYSEIGSKIVVQTTLSRLETWCEKYERRFAISSQIPTQTEAEEIFSYALDHALSELGKERDRLARKHKSDVKSNDLACTLLTFIATPHWTMAMQIGDGFIVARFEKESTYRLLCIPSKGEYAYPAQFVTLGNAKDTWSVAVFPQPAMFMAAASDGIEKVALDFLKNYTPSARFFKDFEHGIRNDSSIEETQKNLRIWLDSPKLNAHTDDDKLFLIAVVDQQQ